MRPELVDLEAYRTRVDALDRVSNGYRAYTLSEARHLMEILLAHRAGDGP